MAINYSVRKKVDKSGKKAKELYYAVPKALQSRGDGIDEVQLAKDLEKLSSLSAGDVLSVLELLSGRIAHHLSNGRTVNIRGLGTFFAGISSEGVESPEQCTADKVRVTRVCYKADKQLSQEVKRAEFLSLEMKMAKVDKKS